MTAPRSPAGFSRGELGAALALAAAAATGATSPWLPVPAWLPIPLVAGGALLVGRACGARLPRPIVPWRLGVEIAALAVVAQGLALGQRLPHAHSLVALAGVALVATVLAAAVNNLPASVVLGGAVGGSSVYAALAGLSVGALATPHGSVATMLTLERSRIVLPRYIRRLAPLALAATLGVVGLVRVGA